MHPNVFLRSFWRRELRPQIFVAMSFAEAYQDRYENVIASAISSIYDASGTFLKPYRVDFSKSGDSILTDIMDGIAHSQMIVADVSTVGKDSVTRKPYRNPNVLYEIGIALACRQPQEVLLIRDDDDPFLFDVSTIYHMKLDFTEVEEARTRLQQELIARLKERDFVDDIRVKTAIDSLTNQEVHLLKQFSELEPEAALGFSDKTIGSLLKIAGISRLLDKQLIVVAGRFEEGFLGYRLTHFGKIVSEIA